MSSASSGYGSKKSDKRSASSEYGSTMSGLSCASSEYGSTMSGLSSTSSGYGSSMSGASRSSAYSHELISEEQDPHPLSTHSTSTSKPGNKPIAVPATVVTGDDSDGD